MTPDPQPQSAGPTEADRELANKALAHAAFVRPCATDRVAQLIAAYRVRCEREAVEKERAAHVQQVSPAGESPFKAISFENEILRLKKELTDEQRRCAEQINDKHRILAEYELQARQLRADRDAAVERAEQAGQVKWFKEPRCHSCGKPATCHGTYEGVTGYGCDECCGHGCEDGHCEPIEPPSQPQPDPVMVAAATADIEAARTKPLSEVADELRGQEVTDVDMVAGILEWERSIRDDLGRLAHAGWMKWVQSQDLSKSEWLTRYENLSESQQEGWRQVGEAVFVAVNARQQAGANYLDCRSFVAAYDAAVEAARRGEPAA